MAEMPAAEFRAWAVYRKRRGFAVREQHLLMAQLLASYLNGHLKEGATPIRMSDVYAPSRRTDSSDGDGMYSAENLKTIQSLKGTA